VRSGSAHRGSPQEAEDTADKSGPSSTDLGPTASRVPVPRFLCDRSATDSDSESLSHGQGGGYTSRALSILSNDYDFASIDSPMSPRQSADSSAQNSSAQRSQGDREREDSKLSACNAALHDLISHLQTLRCDDERAGQRRHRMPSWEDEITSMSAISTMDSSAHFSGNLFSSTPGSSAMMSLLGTSPSSRSGLDAASASILLRNRASSSMNPLRSAVAGNPSSLRRGSSPLTGSRTMSPTLMQRRGSQASPRGARDDCDDTSRGSGGSTVSISARRERDMAAIGLTAEDRIHQLQQLRVFPEPSRAFAEQRSNTPPLVPHIQPGAPSLSNDDAPEYGTGSAPLGSQSMPGQTTFDSRGGEPDKKESSPAAGSEVLPTATPFLSLGSSSMNGTSSASSMNETSSASSPSMLPTKLNLQRAESNSPFSGAMQKLDRGRTGCDSPASAGSAAGPPAVGECSFRRRAISTSRDRAISSRVSREGRRSSGGVESRVAASVGRSLSSLSSTPPLHTDVSLLGRPHRTLSDDSSADTSFSSSGVGHGRYEMLPENRRRSIEVRARSGLDHARGDQDAQGLGGGEAGVAAKKPGYLASEQQTELVALEVLQDVASSSVSADTARQAKVGKSHFNTLNLYGTYPRALTVETFFFWRQLEYMLESLQPFSETPLTMRVMDVVEALGTIIQRKLNVLRDMESVFP